jgi:hypothetical protein
LTVGKEIHSPYLINYDDVFEVDGHCCASMELMDSSLKETVEKHRVEVNVFFLFY